MALSLLTNPKLALFLEEWTMDRSARPLSVILSLILLLAVLPSLAAGTDDPTVWPKSFTLKPGQAAQFAALASSPGTVTLTATWQGGPLAIGMNDAWGKTILAVPPQAPPSCKATMTVTEEILRHGIQYLLVLSVPKTADKPAVGQITVSFAASTAPQATIVPNLKTPLAGGIKAPVTVKLPGEAEPPQLQSVTPDKAQPINVVTLKARGVLPSVTWTQVFFTIAKDTAVQAKVMNITKAADGTITIDAQVPQSPAAILPYDGDVYLKLADQNPVIMTSALPFHFTPTPLAPGTPIQVNTAPRLALQYKVNVCDMTNSYVQLHPLALDEASGLAFLTTSEQNKDYGTTTYKLTAYTVSTGAQAWSKPKAGPLGYNVPYTAFGLLYVPEDWGSTLRAYDPRTGAVRWSHDSRTDLGGAIRETGYFWVIPGTNDLYCLFGGSVKVQSQGTPDAAGRVTTADYTVTGRLVALDPQTGNLRWKLDSIGETGPPAFDATSMYLCGTKGFLAYDNKQLTTRWTVNPTAGIVAWAPAVTNGLVIGGGVGSKLYAISADTGKTAWEVRPARPNVPTQSEGPISPVLESNGILYVVTAVDKLQTTGTLCAINAKTGAQLWATVVPCEEFWLSLDNPPLVMVNGVLLYASWKLYAVNPANGQILWQYDKHFQGISVSRNTIIVGVTGLGEMYAFSPQ
jgi:outer membrane protein assembly factor BamB